MQERFKTFTLLINKISRSIRKIKTGEMAELELKSTHVSCIYYLYTMQSLTAKELCEVCEEDKAAVSRSIEYLEKGGYIETVDKGNKKYKRPLELTEKGYIIGKQLSERIDSILEQASAGISEEERAIMYRALAVISENLHKISSEYEN